MYINRPHREATTKFIRQDAGNFFLDYLRKDKYKRRYFGPKRAIIGFIVFQLIAVIDWTKIQSIEEELPLGNCHKSQIFSEKIRLKHNIWFMYNICMGGGPSVPSYGKLGRRLIVSCTTMYVFSSCPIYHFLKGNSHDFLFLENKPCWDLQEISLSADTDSFEVWGTW